MRYPKNWLYRTVGNLFLGHLLVRCRCINPCFLPPDQERNGNKINSKGQEGAKNVKVLHPHAIDPWSQYEQHNNGNDVAHEDHTHQSVTDDLYGN